VADALRNVLQNLTALIPPLSSQIISILTRRASDALQPVRSMPLQFRAMSNKRPPSEPSFFVAAVLRPVRVFFGVESGGGSGAPLREKLMRPYAEEVFEAVVQKYTFYVTAMRKKEESLRKLKKGKKPAFSLFGGAPKEDDGRDEERIRQQMVLDVEAFGKDAEALGVDVLGSTSFKSLHEMAIAPLNDGELMDCIPVTSQTLRTHNWERYIGTLILMRAVPRLFLCPNDNDTNSSWRNLFCCYFLTDLPVLER
jgi:conserved oligomeric Golgi complex subunit 2